MSNHNHSVSSNVDLLTIPDVDKRKCELLGTTALIVQALLGVFVILSLVFKRYREKPHRPWRIWLFDVSKQIVGQMFVHGLNLFVSASGAENRNGCVFYFLNILVDTTLGVAILYGFLHISTYLLSDKFGFKGFESGQYGTPPSIYYWARQAAIYVLSLTFMKFLVLAMLIYIPGSHSFGEWLLSWTYTEKGDDLQVIFVMGIFPIIMNILQFWIIDSIVKASAAVGLDIDDDYGRQSHDREPLFASHSDDDDDDLVRSSRNDVEAGLNHKESLGKMSQGSTTVSVPSQNKSARSSLSDVHDYPPTLTSSLPSSSSSSHLPSSFTNTHRSTSPSPSISPVKSTKRRRSPPPQLDIHPAGQPVINSPNVSAPPLRSDHAQPKLQMPQPLTHTAWDNSWDDSDWTESRNDP